jgi:hypothetical protein
VNRVYRVDHLAKARQDAAVVPRRLERRNGKVKEVCLPVQAYAE